MMHPQKSVIPKASSENMNGVDESLTQPPLSIDDHRIHHHHHDTIGSPPLPHVPCGPHPSQIRVTSPRQNGGNCIHHTNPTDTATKDDDDDDESEDPVQKPTKPVVLVLPSSPKKPQPIMNQISHTPHASTNAVSSLSLPVFLYTSPLNSLQQLLTTLPSVPSQPPSQSSPGPVLHNNHYNHQNDNNYNDCDYDHSPTELYQLIEQKQWTRILQKFDAAELDDDDDDGDDKTYEPTPTRHYSIQRRRSSIRQQARQWMVRKEANGRLKWRILPLHAAIIFRAPHAVVEAILQCDANSARQKDDQGMIPLHLAMKNFSLQYNHHHHHQHHNSSSPRLASQYQLTPESTKTPWSNSNTTSTSATSSLVDTITTVWRTVEELLTTYPSGIYSRDRKGRTPLQLGLQTIQKNYDVIHSNSSSSAISRQAMALRQQQQEMMLAALSVLERYETIYSTAMRDQTTTATGAHVTVPPPPSSPSLGNNISVDTPPIDAGIVDDKAQRKQNAQRHDENTVSILSIQQQHLETLQTLRTMFQKQRDDDRAKHERQKFAVQQQLNDSIHRECQLQIELENTKRQLQELQSQCGNYVT